MPSNWAYYRQRRDEFLKGKSCAKCGDTENYLTVTWCEYPGPFSSAYIWQFGDEEKRQRYLADCYVLCRSCLGLKSNPPRTEHGGGMKGVTGCRCIPCKARRAKTARETHQRRRARGKK